MPEEINGITFTAYLSGFINIIYALAATVYFTHWEKLFRDRRQYIFNPEHIAWSILFFISLILNWYTSWPRMEYLNKGFFEFIIVFFPIIIFYFISLRLFPNLDKEKNLDLYFSKNIRWIIGLYVLYFLIQNLTEYFLEDFAMLSPSIISRFVIILAGLVYLVLNTKFWLRVFMATGIILILITSIQFSR
jgi:hypothetical protein